MQDDVDQVIANLKSQQRAIKLSIKDWGKREYIRQKINRFCTDACKDPAVKLLCPAFVEIPTQYPIKEVNTIRQN